MTLPDKTDIIVIGAGVMGASIAFNLAKSSDKRVLVLDQHGPLGGMSGRTFGQVRMHYSNALTLEMAHFGMKYVANWEAEVGVGRLTGGAGCVWSRGRRSKRAQCGMTALLGAAT